MMCCFRLVSRSGNEFQNVSTTVVPVQSRLARSVSSQKALDMSQLWKVFLEHDTRIKDFADLCRHKP